MKWCRFIAMGLVVTLFGCQPKEMKYQVSIVTKVCDPTVDPFKDVGYLKVRVLGPDLVSPLESTAPTGGASHQVTIPEVPAGKARVIEVRGYDMDPKAGGQVISMGRSVPFDVPDVIPAGNAEMATQITVFLRKVGTLTRISSATSPTDCQQMKVARAGHTATVLKNGKVFIAGGYAYAQGSAAKNALFDTELYDPQTGTFETAHEISIANGLQRLARAFHTATLLQSGQVLIWGGETYLNGVNNDISPSAIILIYDADENNFGPLRSRVDPMVVARTEHSAAMDANGKVLIVGGKTRDQNLQLVLTDKVEWFDPTTNDYLEVSGVSLPRDGASVLPVQNGSFIAVAGGTDGGTMQTDVSFFQWGGTAFTQKMVASPPRLAAPGRRDAAAATINSTNDLVLAGGYTDPLTVSPVATSEVVGTQTGMVSAGATVGSRGEACAVTLPNGDVFIAGGRTVDNSSMPKSDDSTVLLHVDAMGGTEPLGGPTLAVPRYQHTCSLLQDGTVLVAGGVNEQSGIFTILQDAYIYQPPPND